MALIDTSIRDPKQILLDMYDRENQTFKNDYLPLLEQMQKDMAGRRDSYTQAAVTDAQNLSRLQDNTVASQRSQLGVAQTSEQAQAAGRKNALSLAQNTVVGQNKAIDTADQKNLETANALADITTGIKNQAISNASSAAGLASGRDQVGAQNKANAQAQNVQLGTTVATTAAMIFL